MTDMTTTGIAPRTTRIGPVLWFAVALIGLAAVLVFPLGGSVFGAAAVAWTWAMRFKDARYTGLRWFSLLVLVANLTMLFLAMPVGSEVGPVTVTEVDMP